MGKGKRAFPIEKRVKKGKKRPPQKGRKGSLTSSQRKRGKIWEKKKMEEERSLFVRLEGGGKGKGDNIPSMDQKEGDVLEEEKKGGIRFLIHIAGRKEKGGNLLLDIVKRKKREGALLSKGKRGEE